MKSIIVFLFFVAAFMIIAGVYEQKLEVAQQNKKIEYRFIPRTFLEEQMGNGGTVSDKFGTMFDNESPWFDRTVGPILDIQKPWAGTDSSDVSGGASISQDAIQ